MPGLFNKEHLALQSTVLYFKRKPSALAISYMHSWPHNAGGAAESFKASTGWLEKERIA